MTVAVKSTPDITSSRLLNRLAVESLLGVLYVLLGIGVVFYGIPKLWWAWISPALLPTLGSFVDVALLAVAMIAPAGGLVFFGLRLLGPNPPHGLHAGIAVGLAGVWGIGLLTVGVGTLLERYWLQGADTPALGIGLTLAVGLALLVLAGRAFVRPDCEKWLFLIEDQGWFSTAAYKRSQGQRVRRGTILGILVLAACGIYTLIAHKVLETGPQNWALVIPFSGGWLFPLLPDVRFTVPLLLVVAALWLAYRVVNYPVFADFLIATEAELNKVSWTTQKRLVQDTIVVLTTVILMTVFLFVVDILWGWILSREWIGVLRVDQNTRQPDTSQQEQPW